jgi:hypothetical protein
MRTQRAPLPAAFKAASWSWVYVCSLGSIWSSEMKAWNIALAGMMGAGLLACDTPVQPLGDVLDTTRIETSDPLSSNAIDLLFVIDNSNSMLPFQQELVARFDELIDVLAGLNADFHIGVITTTGNANRADGGGKLQDRPYAQCSATQVPDEIKQACAGFELQQPFLTSGVYRVSQADGTFTIDQDRLARDFRCIASVGVCGAPYEAGIDSLRAALSPSTAPVPGVLDTVNADFLREDAYLGVVFITDEDDCSFGDNYDVSSSNDCYTGDLRPQMTPIQDVYDLLVSLKDGDPSRVFVAGIMGPDDGIDLVPGVPFENRVSCTPEITVSTPGAAIANANDGERYRQLLELFGTNGVEQSICDESFVDALRRIGRVIRDNLDVNCLNSTPETCNLDADCPEGVACIQPGTAEGDKFCADFEVVVQVSSSANPFSFSELTSPGPVGQTDTVPSAEYTIDYEAIRCSTGVSFSFSGGSRPAPGARFRATYPILIDAITAAEAAGSGE